LIGGATGVVQQWDVSQAKATAHWEIGTDSIWCIAVAPDGSLAAAGTGKGAHHEPGTALAIIDLKNGAVVHTFPGHNGVNTAIKLSADGQTLWSTGDDSVLRQTNIQTGRTEREIELGGDGIGTAFAAVSEWYVSDIDQIRMFDQQRDLTFGELRGNQRFQVSGRKNGVGAYGKLALSSDGRTLAAGSENGIDVWVRP
jgi:WD40 repeat protein